MKAGKLRHRVTIQRLKRGQDPITGELVNDWLNLDTVWAAVEPLSVREFIQAGATQSEVTTRITMRKTDVKAADRILHRGKVFNVTGVLVDPKSGLEYVTCPCSEGVNNG
ncbi:head-tail adaptor protein [Oligella urethralis]|uniref:phage head closure protein n=1 Tax=Oligella urethralis TaxID=90245 RepID=UPI000CFFBA33|nr:phage head closure protein [Oligella urethralis]AVL70864.1 head-tail adaptor protein [Oligella urethralis]